MVLVVARVAVERAAVLVVETAAVLVVERVATPASFPSARGMSRARVREGVRERAG